MRPYLLALAALAALGLSACSGGDPADPVATLPGSWETQTVVSRTLLTLSTPQTLRRPDQPGTGGLALAGDVSGTLRYFMGAVPTGVGFVTDRALFSDGDNVTAALRFNSGPPTNVKLIVGVTSGGSGVSLDLVSYDGAEPFTRTATYVEAHNARFALAADPTFEVTVTGRLTFPVLTVPANQETAIITTTTPRVEAAVLTRTFGDGGAYTQRKGDLSTETGTWADLGGGQVRTLVGATTTTYGYGISGSTLTLSLDDAPTCDAECQLELVYFYGAQEGTFVALRGERVETLTRGAEAPARPSASPGLESPAAPTAGRATAGRASGRASGLPAGPLSALPSGLPAGLFSAQ